MTRGCCALYLLVPVSSLQPRRIYWWRLCALYYETKFLHNVHRTIGCRLAALLCSPFLLQPTLSAPCGDVKAGERLKSLQQECLPHKSKNSCGQRGILSGFTKRHGGTIYSFLPWCSARSRLQRSTSCRGSSQARPSGAIPIFLPIQNHRGRASGTSDEISRPRLIGPAASRSHWFWPVPYVPCASKKRKYSPDGKPPRADASIERQHHDDVGNRVWRLEVSVNSVTRRDLRQLFRQQRRWTNPNISAPNFDSSACLNPRDAAVAYRDNRDTHPQPRAAVEDLPRI